MTKMIKRLICGMLALTMCCGLAISGVSAETESGLTDEQADALDVLRQMEIISDFYDYNVALEENVTRADFANIVARIINLETYSGNNTYYYDVPQSHYGYNAICALTQAGILKGTASKIFRPDEPIEYAAAYKILLAIMGYDERAEALGGYPMGYLQVAARVGLVDSAPADDYMTRGEMLTVIFRAVKTEMYEPVWITSDGMTHYTVSENETLLTLYHDIYYGKATVNGAEMCSLNGVTLTEADEVVLDKGIYKTKVSLNDMLGEQIEYFMHYDKAKEEGTVIWAETTGATDVIVIEEGQKSGFDKASFTLSYITDSGRAKSVNLKRSITVIYNGKEVDRDIDKIFERPYYSVKLIKGQTEYETAIVREYSNIVVESIDTKDFVIYDAAHNNQPVKLDENLYDYISIRNAENTKISFSDISAGDVLSIFLSKDEKMIEVLVSSRIVSGVVKQVGKTGKKTQITIDDTAYIKAENAEFDIPAVGTNTTLYINHKGFVAYAGKMLSNSSAVYVIQVKKIENAFDEELKFRVLKEDGTVAYLDAAKTVVIDGKKAENADEIINAFKDRNTGEHLSQLALINVNKDGKINKIDTAYVRPDVEDIRYTLSVDLDRTVDASYRWMGYFTANRNEAAGQTYTKNAAILNDNTKIFKIPTSLSAEDKDFTVITKGSLYDYEKHTIKTYKVSDRPGYTKWMEIEAKTGTVYESKTILVSDVIDVLDESGEVRRAIVGYQGNTEVTYYAADGKADLFNDVERGTLLSVIRDFRGNVESKRIEFTPETTGPFTNSVDAYWETRGIVKGYIYDIIGDVIKISYDMPSGLGEDQVEQRWTQRTAPVLIYDKADENNPISVGSFADAKTYYNLKENCSKVVLSANAGEPVMYVIYK